MKSRFFTLFVSALLLPGPSYAQQDSGRTERDAAISKAQVEAQKTEAEFRKLQDDVEKWRAELSETSGLVAATPETIRQLAERLQTEKETLQLEEAGARGRESAITKAIAKTTDNLRERADADEVTKQMQAVVAVRQAQLDRVRQLQGNGTAPKAEVESAEAALATARADLALARQKTSTGSTDLLEALNRELINLAITRQERAARLQFIENRLKQLAPALAHLRGLEVAIHELQRAERDHDAALDRLRSVQRGGN